jgi:hypothetical protein
MPKQPTGPIVDAHDYQKFSMGMVALSLIAGGLSKSHWMNAASSLDGALKGYLAGNEELAKKKRDDFEQAYKLAVEQEERQNKEYAQALGVRDRSIKDILAQADVIANKYGMIDAQDAIRRRDLDGMFKAISTRQDTLTRMGMMKQKMDQDYKDHQTKKIEQLFQNDEITPEERERLTNAIDDGQDPGHINYKPMDPHSLELAKEQYFQTGTLPSMGMKNNNARMQIINGANEIGARLGLTPADIVRAWATRKADLGALMQVDRQQALVGGYEQTARSNLEMLQSISQKLSRSQYSQLYNQWLQYGRVKLGDPTADQFNAALEETLSEYAKVMGGGYGAGSSTEGAQNRSHSLMSAMSTPDQLNAVADTMRQSMTNRMNSIEHQKKTLVDGLRSGGSGNSGGGNVIQLNTDGTLRQ